MPTPEFVLELRKKIGHDLLWLNGVTGCVLDDRGRLLLGRRSDTGEWAMVYGINEPGEQPADTVVREIKEETGIDLGEVRYLGSQPWPFPASLMMAFKAQALSTDILVDGEETETARWVTRDEYTIELSEGRMEAPGKSTIARYMIEEWYGREL